MQAARAVPGLKPAAQAPWPFFGAVVQAWVDATWCRAWVEGPQFSRDGLCPDDEQPAPWDDPAAAAAAAVVLLRRGRPDMALRVLGRAAGRA